MKTTSISIQNSRVTLSMTDEPGDTQQEDRGQHRVRITLPDGREFRYVDDSGAKFQDVVELSERDGLWDARHGYIPVAGCIGSGEDYYESDELEFTSRETALGVGLERARELGVPLIERSWPGEIGDGPVYVCLFQPLQVVVRDRLGEVTFTARNGTLEPACEGTMDDAQLLHGIIVSESMEPAVLSGLVCEAWGAPCSVTVRLMPVLHPEVKGVSHE
jgi:hypothetical protein